MFNKKTILYHSLAILIFSVIFLQIAPIAIIADVSTTTEIIPSSGKATGEYTLNDFLLLAVNFSKFLLGITGSLALLAFVAGGTMYLISGGNQERIGLAQKMITGAVIGIVIVFTSYIIIGFIFTAMGAGGSWFQSNWMN